MAHILHLDSSPRGERSVSRSLAKEFISDWKAAHPDDTVTYRDIGHHPVPFVNEAWIAAAYSSPDQHTPELAEAIRISNELVDEFLAADRYVFGIPMYNYSIPANFKAYIDQIVRVGRTFSVDENGYKGLVDNKKATIITANGGAYPEGSPIHDYDLQTPYLRLIFGFMGITDVNFVHADSQALGDEARKQAIADAQAALKEAVAHW
ncbi:FMN-dependent NADH-azoreductase [Oculatella sp. LEGE 06141]|uniref:FMN-dependent NADH-azoreductase n=1 Tax=Oculatella sp. LEGE 06141 TaxID=1828648 RepID=UPI00187FF9BA|nr:FMN-dependent NADH-azoreductase [Oculatella sp. LEGE 06141]MBE9180189.1 FMN-dependent NADH-azoreductase [Oculatella sp. LEGE 06141]